MKQFFGHIPEAVKGPEMDRIKMGMLEVKSHGVAWQINQQDDRMTRKDENFQMLTISCGLVRCLLGLLSSLKTGCVCVTLGRHEVSKSFDI